MASKSKKANQARSGGSLKGFYYLLGAIAVAGIAVIAWVNLKGGKAASEPIELSEAQLKDVNALVQSARGIKKGPESAPVRLLVFSDYMCPACKHFTTNVEPSFREQYVNTGKVQMVYYDYPLGGAHRWSFLAARAGRCAEEQNKFWEYHDRLFATQQEWSYDNSAPVKRFETFAQELGLNAGDFKGCLNSDKHADVVSANYALGQQLGVRGTPTLFMNGRQLPEEWNDFNKLKARLDAELGATAGSPAAPAATTTTQ